MPGIKQKDVVFAAFMSIVGEGKTVADATETQRQQVKEQVASQLHDGSCDWDDPDKSPEHCLRYAGSLVSNWFKKDPRLNGVGKYTPKTRRGPLVKDEELKKLIAARDSAVVLGRTEVVPQLESRIAQRKEQLKLEKAKTKVLSQDELAATLTELGL
jgi:hypothetical protein